MQSERSPFASLRIPESWPKLALPCCENAFQYAECELDAGGNESRIALKRLVKIEVPQSGKKEEVPTAHVFLKGKKLLKEEVATPLIDRISKLDLCPGAGVQPVAGECPSFNGNCCHKKCTLLTKNAGGACISCKYQCKLIMNQLSRRRSKNVKSKPNKTSAVRRALRRVRVKLQKAQVSLSQLKAKNEQLPREFLSKKSKGFH